MKKQATGSWFLAGEASRERRIFISDVRIRGIYLSLSLWLLVLGSSGRIFNLTAQSGGYLIWPLARVRGYLIWPLARVGGHLIWTVARGHLIWPLARVGGYSWVCSAARVVSVVTTRTPGKSTPIEAETPEVLVEEVGDVALIYHTLLRRGS